MCGMIAARTPMDLRNLILTMGYRGEGSGSVGYEKYHTLNRGTIQMAHISLPFVTRKNNDHIQPKLNEVGQPVGMFVGEIFNYKELGYNNDIECINDYYHTSGDVVNFHNFNGFWSYISVKEGSLIGVVDHLGIKPLYYRTDMEAIASEPNVLHSLHDPWDMDDPLFFSNVMKWGYDPTPRTTWEKIKQVPPGHYVIYDSRGENPRVVKYWDWQLIEPLDLNVSWEFVVRWWMGGFRKVPVLLSGGLDSTIIYKTIKRITDEPVDIIHVENDERGFVDEVVDPSDNLHLVTLEDVSDTEAVIAHQTPVDLGSVKPQLAMAKKLQELGYNAVMTGDGADELFGGYRRAKEYDSQHSDTFCELPYYHLPRLDRIMMRKTIECRSPFLSPIVVRKALDLPYSQRTSKQYLKETFKDIVPQSIIDRDKHPLKTLSIRTNPMEQRRLNTNIWRHLHG
jgi:asparagine synthetase B (glutamine-hydrolysing)